MHAVIKIISFLVFGAAITLAQGPILLAGALLVAGLYLFGRTGHGHALQMLYRLRWLFISILVVYLFFTPGQLLWPALAWGPTLEGLIQGGTRIAALVLLVAAVNWVIASTAQADFLAAVIWCLRPLSRLGLPHERLALRITLTLESVTQLRQELRQSLQQQQRDRQSTQGSRLGAIVGSAREVVQEVMQRAETMPLREISLPLESRPPLLQWCIPLALALLFGILTYHGDALWS